MAAAQVQVTKSRQSRTARKTGGATAAPTTEAPSKMPSSDGRLDGFLILSGREVLHVNETFARVIARDVSELVGTPVEQVLTWVDPEHREKFARAIRRALERGSGTGPFRLRFLRPDGSLREVLAAISAVFLGQERVVQLSCLDVSEQVEASRKLEQWRRFVEVLFRSTPMGVVLLNRGKVERASSAFCQWLGVSEPSEIAGLSFEMLVAEGERAAFRRWLREVTKSPVTPKMRVSLTGPSGKATQVEIAGAAEPTGRGKLWLFAQSREEVALAQAKWSQMADRLQLVRRLSLEFLTARTEKEAAEAILPLLAKDFRADAAELIAYDIEAGNTRGIRLASYPTEGPQLQAFPEGWWVDSLAADQPLIVDRHSKDAPPWLSPALEPNFETYCCIPLRAEGTLVGALNLASFAPNGFKDIELEYLKDIAGLVGAGLRQARLRELANLKAQDLERLVRERSKELEDKSAELEELNEALVNLLEDLRATNRRLENTTRALERSNEDLRSFLTMVSHDLRAPLRAIQGFTEAALEDGAGQLSEDIVDYLERAREAARRMDELIEDLLEYSRLGTMRIQIHEMNLDEIADEVLSLFETEIERSKAVVHVQKPLGSVLGQDRILVQVLSNLVSNALKFVPESTPPRVKIWSEERGSALRVWVEDNGIGIEPQHHGRIFRVFERLHGIEKYPGTGIGLAIVRRGIERLGGKVGLESEPGKGSRFWFELPRP